jgi:hypothetical protein
MLWDLQRLDLEGWHPRDAIPQTEELRQQKLLSLSGLEQWYVAKLDIGQLPQCLGFANNPRRCHSTDLFEDAKAFSTRNRYITETEFGLFLKRQGCEHKSNGKQWGWVFPPLAECRRAWEVKCGGEWEWLAPLEDWSRTPPPDREAVAKAILDTPAELPPRPQSRPWRRF